MASDSEPRKCLSPEVLQKYFFWGGAEVQGHNIGLKNGRTKLEAPRIEMLKALSGVERGKETPLPSQLGVRDSGRIT